MTVAPRLGELRLDGLGRSFGSQVALAALDLRIEGGEFIALLGPSGCGKSTALNCIAGLIAPTRGTISLDGRSLEGMPSERRGFGVVFQSYALFAHMSVRANIAFGLRMRRLPKAQIAARVDQALALVQLEVHADKYPSQLSGGQQQRGRSSSSRRSCSWTSRCRTSTPSCAWRCAPSCGACTASSG